MTPKEKAKELFDKHFDFVEAWSASNQIENAKQCALITVDEIMKAPHENSYIQLIPEKAEKTDWFWDKFDEYWNEVKTEIKKITL